ncbi:MAG TPA: conjugal transfer protein TrbF [Xanthobacteraceae bacterium]|jgi:type IV secretory pathway TrbF-like protein/predicted MFS family arabinose efflux permease
MQNWRLMVCVFLPFAGSYYLAYLFRTVNALISRRLTSDLAVSAASLGLLTSVYFLVFAAAQVPVGMLLDRFGPRRIQSALLVIAAAGAALFGIAQGLVPLLMARAMIGLGVAAALTAGLKAIVLWFPQERVALLNGYMIMLGALGAVTATSPAERLSDWIGWRGLFELLAAVTAISAAIIFLVVPEPVAAAPKRSTQVSLKIVFADLRFWQLAPLSATAIGSAWALQGLWATHWLTDVEGLDRPGLITQLFIMAVALSLGALLLGTIAERMRRRGIGLHTLFSALAALFIAAQLALILRLPLPYVLSWSVVGVVGAGTVVSYAIVAEYFPKELAGRASAALNVFQFGWAFIVQCATGLVLAQWPSHHDHYPVIAYQVAFGLNIALQIPTLLWFEMARLRTLCLLMSGRCFCSRANDHNTHEPLTPYARALQAWTERLVSARLQTSHWRLAALGSASLCAALALALTIAAERAGVTPYVVEVEHLDEAPTADPPITEPSDAQIAYLLARFVNDIRSLSTDPIVVRANWMDALNYVSVRGAQTLSDDARVSDPFIKIGRQSVMVDVIYVVRASAESFEIRWRENTYQNGTIAKAETFTGTAQIIVKAINSAETLRNPLGLYVQTFTWSRDNTPFRNGALTAHTW